MFGPISRQTEYLIWKLDPCPTPSHLPAFVSSKTQDARLHRGVLGSAAAAAAGRPDALGRCPHTSHVVQVPSTLVFFSLLFFFFRGHLNSPYMYCVIPSPPRSVVISSKAWRPSLSCPHV